MSDQAPDQLAKGQRRTPSGIVLPPRDEGMSVVVLQSEPNLQWNVDLDVDGPGGAEALLELAREINMRQALLAAGHNVEPLELAEPHFGYRYFLTTEGIRSVKSVTPGFAQRIDPMVFTRRQEKRRGPGIALPPGFPGLNGDPLRRR